MTDYQDNKKDKVYYKTDDNDLFVSDYDGNLNRIANSINDFKCLVKSDSCVYCDENNNLYEYDSNNESSFISPNVELLESGEGFYYYYYLNTSDGRDSDIYFKRIGEEPIKVIDNIDKETNMYRFNLFEDGTASIISSSKYKNLIRDLINFRIYEGDIDRSDPDGYSNERTRKLNYLNNEIIKYWKSLNYLQYDVSYFNKEETKLIFFQFKNGEEALFQGDQLIGMRPNYDEDKKARLIDFFKDPNSSAYFNPYQISFEDLKEASQSYLKQNVDFYFLDRNKSVPLEGIDNFRDDWYGFRTINLADKGMLLFQYRGDAYKIYYDEDVAKLKLINTNVDNYNLDIGLEYGEIIYYKNQTSKDFPDLYWYDEKISSNVVSETEVMSRDKDKIYFSTGDDSLNVYYKDADEAKLIDKNISKYKEVDGVLYYLKDDTGELYKYEDGSSKLIDKDVKDLCIIKSDKYDELWT